MSLSFFVSKKNEYFDHLKHDAPFVHLVEDNWNDYSYRTQFYFSYYNDKHSIIISSQLKIAFTDSIMKSKGFSKDELNYIQTIPRKFDTLEDGFFSVGADESFYKRLDVLSDDERDELLCSLNDIAYDLNKFDLLKRLNLDVFTTSLMREYNEIDFRNRIHRIATGGVVLTEYNFVFDYIKHEELSTQVTFDVIPQSYPPTNLHVLIGSNGVGKTHFLNRIIGEYFNESNEQDSINELLNLVVISFSPFDRLFMNLDQEMLSKRQYDYIGLRDNVVNIKSGNFKKNRVIEKEFFDSLIACAASSSLKKRWLTMISMLEIDGYFREREISKFIESISPFDIKKGVPSEDNYAKLNFRELSSGHKIILFSLTRLVHVTIEKSLILYDEPETYLHPPLLSAYMRALSWLLIDRNAVSIIATHSPIILQEVPRKNVWIIQRSGEEFNVLRPNIETFGESVSSLTKEVFQLEYKKSGYYTLISKCVETVLSECIDVDISNEKIFKRVMSKFGNEVGDEGMSIILSEIYRLREGNNYVHN